MLGRGRLKELYPGMLNPIPSIFDDMYISAYRTELIILWGCDYEKENISLAQYTAYCI